MSKKEVRPKINIVGAKKDKSIKVFFSKSDGKLFHFDNKMVFIIYTKIQEESALEYAVKANSELVYV